MLAGRLSPRFDVIPACAGTAAAINTATSVVAPVASFKLTGGTAEAWGASRRFRLRDLHNSWGASCGEGGYVWISEPGLRKHITSAYLVEAVPTGGVPPALPSLPQIPSLPFPSLPAGPGLANLPAWPWPSFAQPARS